jgi:hypothetical protein
VPVADQIRPILCSTLIIPDGVRREVRSTYPMIGPG